jgi:hypothetical protein
MILMICGSLVVKIFKKKLGQESSPLNQLRAPIEPRVCES